MLVVASGVLLVDLLAEQGVCADTVPVAIQQLPAAASQSNDLTEVRPCLRQVTAASAPRPDSVKHESQCLAILPLCPSPSSPPSALDCCCLSIASCRHAAEIQHHSCTSPHCECALSRCALICCGVHTVCSTRFIWLIDQIADACCLFI